MEQKDIERFAYLYLCSKKDMAILSGRAIMKYEDFERLTYLTEFFGMSALNLELWNQYTPQFANQLNALMRMDEENIVEETGYADEETLMRYDLWVKEFCENISNEELQSWMREQVDHIYKAKEMEPLFGQADAH